MHNCTGGKQCQIQPVPQGIEQGAREEHPSVRQQLVRGLAVFCSFQAGLAGHTAANRRADASAQSDLPGATKHWPSEDSQTGEVHVQIQRREGSNLRKCVHVVHPHAAATTAAASDSSENILFAFSKLQEDSILLPTP